MKKLLLSFLLAISLTVNCWAGINFDGVDDVLSCGTGDDIMTENGAMSIYMSFNFAVGGSVRFMAERPNTGDVIFGINGSNQVTFTVNGGTALSVITSTTLTATNNYKLILTWDGSTTAANAHIYINGAEASYGTQTNGATPTNNSGGTLYLFNRSIANRPFNGIGREAAFWNAVISAQDIVNLQSNVRNAPLMTSVKPVRYFRIDDGTDTVSADGVTVHDYTQIANCTGDNGANNTGLTWAAETILNYPDGILQ